MGYFITRDMQSLALATRVDPALGLILLVSLYGLDICTACNS